MFTKFFNIPVIGLLIIIMASCVSQDFSDDYKAIKSDTRSASELVVIDKDSSILKFAEILSRVTYNRKDVREFLKKEAMKEFDLNNDILYLAVKDESISGQNFEEIMASYSSLDTIRAISENVPLLNILIPDIACFDVFASNLDCEDKETPVATMTKEGMALYINGISEMIIEKGEIPDFHTFVVNENNRVQIKENTRSSNKPYEFISEYYDKEYMQNRNTRSDVYVQNLPAFVGGRAIQAYSYFHGTGEYPAALQRDYIYYGLTPTINEGKYQPGVSEYITSMSVNPNTFFNMTDDLGSEVYCDPNIKNYSVTRKGGEYTEKELISKMWSQGAYNFRFEVYSLNNSLPTIIRLPLRPEELWNFNIKIDHVHGTWFRKGKNTYTINPNDFTEKRVWLYNKGISMGKWDLSQEGLERYILIYEEDKKATKTESVEFEMTVLTSAKVNNSIKIGLGTDISGSIGTDLNTSTTKRVKKTFTTTRDEDDDPLGATKINFYDPIIKARPGETNFSVHSYNTGMIGFTVTAM